MWKIYCRAGQATDDNMARAHCMLDTEGYGHTRAHTRTHTHAHTHARTHTLRLYYNHCFSTATMTSLTRLSVMLYVQCLSCCVVCLHLIPIMEHQIVI